MHFLSTVAKQTFKYDLYETQGRLTKVGLNQAALPQHRDYNPYSVALLSRLGGFHHQRIHKNYIPIFTEKIGRVKLVLIRLL